MIKINYVEVEQPIGTFYLCSINALTLLKLVKSTPRSKSEDGVQRDLQEVRVKKISEYCSDPDAVFPTPIVVSIDRDANVSIDEDNHQIIVTNDEVEIGDVIDGQHRLWGIEKSASAVSFNLPVVLMFDLTLEEKAYIFSTINSNQVKVSPSLIFELFAVSSSRSPQKTVHELARVMNNTKDSPFYNRLKMLGKKTLDQNKATLSQGTFAKTILQLITLDAEADFRDLKLNRQLQVDSRCPFRDYFIEGQDDVIAKILLNCFNALKIVFPEEWQDPHSNVLWKTTGFRAIIYALNSLVRKGLRVKTLTSEFFEMCFVAFKKYLNERNLTLTSKHFPGGGEQSQRILAKYIIEAVAHINLDEYWSNMIRPDSFQDFLIAIGSLDKSEIYDLAKALEGKFNETKFFQAKEEDGNILISYPYGDVVINLTKQQVSDNLKYLEDKYLNGLDVDTYIQYDNSNQDN